MTELKLCPFCKGNLKIIESTHFRFGKDIICTNEWTEGEDKHVTSCPMGGHSFLCSDAELIEKANARPIESALEARVEQLRVQLAGCGVAALGGTKDIAKVGDYGWSPSYQDTLDLRIKYEDMQSRLKETVGEIKEYIETLEKSYTNFDLKTGAGIVLWIIEKHFPELEKKK